MILLDTLPNVTGTALAYTVAAQNISGPGATDGTGLQASILTDEWGFQQAALKYADVAPSGTPEDADTSQILASLINSLSPVGTVLQGMWSTDPASLGIRAILMDGSGILIANYAALVAACYVGDGNNGTADAFYKADDAAGTTPNVAGTYFILPDTRGSFLRDADSAKAQDPYGDRTMGEVQGSYIQDHEHDVQNLASPGSQFLEQSPATVTMTGGTGNSPWTIGGGGTQPIGAYDIQTPNKGADAVAVESTETAPRNAICKFAIRY
jgi:hypothetical protein